MKRQRTAIGKTTVALAIIAIVVVGAIAFVLLTPRPTTHPIITYIQITFLYRTMPKNFDVNGYTFDVVYNGTGYTTSKNATATTNLGFSLVFAVSDGTTNQTITFGWAPPAPAPQSLPVPEQASLFGGKVELNWLSNSTGTYLHVIAG